MSQAHTDYKTRGYPPVVEKQHERNLGGTAAGLLTMR